jgi:hypothetical protein
MWLEYRESNKAAEHLYKKCGYQEVGSFIDGNVKRIVVTKEFN